MTRTNPYIGPRAFQTGETLYGRDREIEELLDLLIAERIVLLHSPSGAGKSSLVYAGLIPRLKQEGFRVLPAARVSLEPPAEMAEQEINCHVLSTLMCLAEAVPETEAMQPQEMLSFSLNDFVSRIEKSAVSQDPEAEPENSFLIFDQFEEVLTTFPTAREDKAAFFNQLGVALRNRNRWALFVMREDFVAALSPYVRSIPTRLTNTYRLDLLSAEAARQAIQKPAALQQIDFTAKASQRLVDDLRRIRVQGTDGTVEEQLGPYVEPVQLQVVCYRLWGNVNLDDGKITEQDVLSIGNVDTALGDYYAERVAAIAKQAQISERTIRDWFNQELITEQGVRGQVLMGAEFSEKLPNSVVHLLENAYLVRSEKRGGAIWFELSHDRLIRPVQDNNVAWLNDHLNLLQRQASLWEERDHNEALLLREKALEEAEAWAIAHAAEMTPGERDYLKACQTNRKREAEAKALAEQEIQLHEQAIAAVRLRRRAYVLAGALLVTLALVVVAIFLYNQAATNAQIAQVNLEAAETASAQVAEQAAIAQAASTQAVAQQGVAESASTQAVAQANVAKDNLVMAVTAESQANEQKATAQAASTQVAQQAATAQAASTQAVAQRDLAATAQVEAERQRDQADIQRQVALSRGLADSALAADQTDLSLLLSVEAYRITHTVQAENALLTSLQNSMVASVAQAGLAITRQNGYVYSLAFSRDGNYLAWGCDNGLLVVWDIPNNRQLWTTYAHHSSIIYTMKFSPDGSLLATGGRDGHFDLWDAKTGKLVQQALTVHGFVLSLDFSPDGKYLATSGLGRTIQIWDTNNVDNPRSIGQRVGGDIKTVAWSPNGLYLATAGIDRVVWLWNTETWETIQRFTGSEGTIDSLAWSPDSKYLASSGKDVIGLVDKTIFLWDISAGTGQPIAGPKDETWSVAFSPDGKELASGGSDKIVYLWDVKSLQPVAKLTDHTHWVTCLAFTQKEPALLATGSFDKTVLVYSLRAPELISHPLPAAKGTVQGFAFTTPDTATVISNQDGNILQSSVNISTSETQQNAFTLQPSLSASTGVAVSRDGTLLAYDVVTEGKPAVIQVVEAASGKQIFKIDPLPGTFSSAAFSPDNQILAVGACLALNKELGFCSQPQVFLWSLQSGQQTAQLPPKSMLDQPTPPTDLNNDSIISLAFSDGNALLATGGKDGSLVIWSLADNSVLTTLSNPSAITAVTFGPNQAGTNMPTLLAYGTSDSKLYLWDVANHRLVAPPFLGVTGSITSLQYSPSQPGILSGSSTGQVLWWDMSPDTWIAKACELAGRNLTQAEWKQYFPGETYHLTCPAYPEGK